MGEHGRANYLYHDAGGKEEKEDCGLTNPFLGYAPNNLRASYKDKPLKDSTTNSDTLRTKPLPHGLLEDTYLNHNNELLMSSYIQSWGVYF
jgi:hypothetical protein